MKTVTVPTALLEVMKNSFGSKFYNNQIDATMSNNHTKRAIENLTKRGLVFTTYTDGVNELIVVGEGANQQHYTGTAVLA